MNGRRSHYDMKRFASYVERPFNWRKLAYPLKWILTRIGKTGYWFNQTFIPMGNYVHYWMQGDEALARYKQPYDPRWYRQK
jgi:hypothetical protein